jgi:hypothetical protein
MKRVINYSEGAIERGRMGGWAIRAFVEDDGACIARLQDVAFALSHETQNGTRSYKGHVVEDIVHCLLLRALLCLPASCLSASLPTDRAFPVPVHCPVSCYLCMRMGCMIP